MRLKSLKYPLFLAYELIRLWALLRLGATGISASLPVTWYAAVPLLCIAPAILFIAIFDEEAVHGTLPVITAIKAFGIPGLALYIAKNFSDAIRFAVNGDFRILGAVVFLTACIICDAVIGAIMYRSSKQSCK